ncbi:DUF6395 domain-containing protein [Kytococcus sedentarius]|uniref:DUF6395 domain-containing protein n=1 Tax=Kytococcus sedentarius TaxID=1276 RepID=UPI0035BC3FBE
MRVRTTHEGERLVLHLTPKGREPRGASPRMVGRSVTLEPVPHDPVHPDVVALVALLTVHPWQDGRLEMDRPVSQVFAAAVQYGLGIEVGPVDPSVEPRPCPQDGPVALAYSGGVDCTAALEVLGPTARAYYQQRHRFDGQPVGGKIDPSAALAAVDHIAEQGIATRVVRTDLELLRDPMGFPHDLVNATPALLWAEHDDTSAMCWGTVLTSATTLGATAYRPYEQSPFVAEFGPAFQAVGLPVANVVAGVSEVGTAIITEESPYGALAASCQRGTPGRPCMRCWKCGRKTLSTLGVTDEWPPGRELDRFLQQDEIARNLRRRPIKVEVALAWAARRYVESQNADHASRVMLALHELTRGVDASPLAASFTPALDPLPARLRTGVQEALAHHLEPMTPAQEQWVRDWTLESHGTQEARDAARARLAEALDPERNPVGREDFDPTTLVPATPQWGPPATYATGLRARLGSRVAGRWPFSRSGR